MNHGIQKNARLRALYEVARIKKIMSWNDYPCYVRNNFKCLEKKKKMTKTLIHLNKIILLQIFAEYPMQEYNEKNSLKMWSKNSKDT